MAAQLLALLALLVSSLRTVAVTFSIPRRSISVAALQIQPSAVMVKNGSSVMQKKGIGFAMLFP